MTFFKKMLFSASIDVTPFAECGEVEAQDTAENRSVSWGCKSSHYSQGMQCLVRWLKHTVLPSIALSNGMVETNATVK